MLRLPRGRIRELPPAARTQLEEEGIRVLHVDDEVGICELVRDFLEANGSHFDVTIESESTTALERVESADESFDCIVSDYQMPRMDGIEFLNQVRGLDPDLPFILFTGKGSEEIASEAISAGVTDYLQKKVGPDQYEVLANRVENAVAGYRAEARFQRAIQAMERSREGISLLDENGRFVYVNHEYADLVGYEREELLGQHWEVLYTDEDAEEMREEILPRISESGRWEDETTYVRADGGRLAVDHGLSFTEDGMLVCLIRPIKGADAR